MWGNIAAQLLILSGSIGGGYALCREIEDELYHYREQKRMLLYMQKEIGFVKRSLDEIFDSVSDMVGEPYNILLREVSGGISSRSGERITEIWKRSARRLSKRYRCGKRAYMSLCKISECFGYNGADLQISALKLTELELNEKIEDILRQKDEKERLIRTLSVICGVFIIILFW